MARQQNMTIFKLEYMMFPNVKSHSAPDDKFTVKLFEWIFLSGGIYLCVSFLSYDTN